MRGHTLLLASCALLLTACFSPTYQEGLACSESEECPGSLSCSAGVCVVPGSQNNSDGGADGGSSIFDGGLDASLSLSDAGLPDAAPCLPGSETFEATGTVETFTVPDCITELTVEAFGAEGGSGVGAAVLGGKGARIKGDVAVAQGEVLQILVGVRGQDAVNLGDNIGEQGGGTGGGGSFVVTENGDALVVAGGGGGASHNTISALILVPGGDGIILSDGQVGGGMGGAGGIAGTGGGPRSNPAGFHGGTGGGGFLSSGDGSSDGNEGLYGTPNGPGAGYGQGGTGGVGGSAGRNGGFGGGGAAGFTGGGGGGYSGGGAGGNFQAPYAGGGGGSLNSGQNQDDSPGVRTGDGQIIIRWSP